MFWIHPQYERSFRTAAADRYDAVVHLRPADHYVEKQGRSTGRYVLQANGEPVSFFLKKYHRMPWWRRWFAPLQSFPGPREWANLDRAATLGVRVPEALAVGADRRHACRSLIALRELQGYMPLHQFIPARFAQGPSRALLPLRRELTRRLADTARRLHQAHLYHCDLYLCHFFVRELPFGSNQFDLVLIDLTRLRHSWWRRWQIKDLAQLLFSSDLCGITRTDRLRFYKHYLGVSRLDIGSRQLLRRIEWKAWLYHRHNERMVRRAAA